MSSASPTSEVSMLSVEHDWTLSSTKDAFFLSEFIGIPGMPIEKAFRFGAHCNSGTLDKVCCYVNSVQLARFGFTEREVICNLPQDQGSNHQNLIKLESVGKEENAILFRGECAGRCVYKQYPRLTFLLYFSGLVKQYAPSRFDVNIGQQLWDAALNGQQTDVVFQVGKSIFSAHRFILSARSPVFRAMFDTDMVESRTGRVQIVDVEEPDVFEQFLHFLYTGQLIKPLSKQLGVIAEKYQVETFVVKGDKTVYSQHSMEPFIPSQHCDKQPFFRSGKIYIGQYYGDLRFVVHFATTVETYQYQLRDSTFAQELWSSFIKKERTDVEFRVGDKTFPAHRALLTARCPALFHSRFSWFSWLMVRLVLFPAESSPSLSTVLIPDMDPDVFEDVLYFLYTGSMRECSTAVQIRDLTEAARIYQIETLRSLVLAIERQQQVDQNELSQVLMAIV